MLRLIEQTKRKYNKKTQKSKEGKESDNDKQPKNEKGGGEEKECHKSSEDETVEGSSSNTDCDQDSDVSFANDTDEENGTPEIEQEDWIEYRKRSTAEAEERMNAAKIPCWIETHRRMKWRLAMRITSLPKETWARKAAEWNPGHNTKIKTCRAVGRPTKRWEDEINDFLATKGSDIKTTTHRYG